MRMTNQIMQNNSLYNINNNKILQDKLSTMMSTQKKLTRPSDDPVVAIRALRLRTSVSELSQYNDKNAKDADAWLTVTEDALSTASDIIGGSNGLIKQMQKAANKDLTPTDINIIMEQIKSLRDEVYATANVDYAGRYIFTGYRTDTPLSFTKDVLKQNLSYDITEQVTINSFDTINYTDMKYVASLSKNNHANYPNITEQNIFNDNIKRLRLSYDEVYDGVRPEIMLMNDPPFNFTAMLEASSNYLTVPSSAVYPDLNAYQTVMAMNAGGVVGAVYVPDTGEILFSDEAYSMLAGAGATGNLAQLENDLQDQIQAIREELEDYFMNYPPRTNAASTDPTDPDNGYAAGDHPNPAWRNNILSPNDVTAMTDIIGSAPAPGTDISTLDLSDDQILALAKLINDELQDRILTASTLGLPPLTPAMIPTLNVAVDAAGYEDYLEIYNQIGQIRAAVDPSTEIQVTYTKNDWKEDDLRPEHYFACISTEVKADGTSKSINYNPEYLTGASNGQIIEYDVGYNQRIRINTLAEDVFRHTLGRNVDDLDNAVRELLEIERIVEDLKGIIGNLSEGTAEYTMVENQLDAAQKAYDFIRNNVHRMFEDSITIMQNALDDINVAVTDSGTRSARLDLISNRLLSQKTTFEILRSENEDIDIAEVAIKLTSTELSYNAALMATGKIMQTSLMNFI